MPDSPSMHCRYVICWRAHDRQQVNGLRPVWLQPSAAVPAMGDVRGPEGWLAGFAFAPETPREACACLPQDILADPQVAVESLFEDLPSWKTDPTSLANNRWTLLSDGTENSRGASRHTRTCPLPQPIGRPLNWPRARLNGRDGCAGPDERCLWGLALWQQSLAGWLSPAGSRPIGRRARPESHGSNRPAQGGRPR